MQVLTYIERKCMLISRYKGIRIKAPLIGYSKQRRQWEGHRKTQRRFAPLIKVKFPEWGSLPVRIKKGVKFPQK